MAKIIIQKKKTAVLEIVLDDEEISIEYRVDSISGYRKTTGVIKQYHDIAAKKDILTDEQLTEEQSIGILDESVALMESFRDAVRVAVRDDQYNKYLKSVEDDIPFISWVQILSEIVSNYTGYFRDLTSVDGEL